MRQARNKIASESSSKQTRHYSETGVYIMQNTIGVGEWSLERKTEKEGKGKRKRLHGNR